MRKLTEKEVKELQGFKGISGGKEKFFEYLEAIYKDDAETMAEIAQCKTIFKDLDWIDSFPAYEKSEEMYFKYMDELLQKIGYHK